MWERRLYFIFHLVFGLFQVSRNFELVGRVNLDQLEQMKEKMESSSSDEEDKEEEVNSKADDTGQSLAALFMPHGINVCVVRWKAGGRLWQE